MWTGLQALAYLERRLAIEGLSQDQFSSGELYDYITEGRDAILQAFAMAAPVVVRTLVTFDDNGDGTHSVPSANSDPYRALELRHVTGKQNLIPSASLEQDGGDYEWADLRTVTLATTVSAVGGLEGFLVLAGDDVDAATAGTRAAWGIPQTCQRAAVKFAAVLALTKNEDSDARAAMALFERELGKLEIIYSEFDGMGGMMLREATLAGYGSLFGENLY